VYKIIYVILAVFIVSFTFTSCAGSAEAHEYFEIGMAYFELGKYEDAEKWLNRARQSNRTMTASTYNLGRIAFEQQRYEEASRLFESILKRDPDNVLALRAAAYSRIRAGDINIAEKHYSRLFELVPERADDGYNHALVLFAMGRYAEAEEVLEQFPLALLEANDTLLLYARIQTANNKPQAIDHYSAWLLNNTDPKVRFEYAAILEKNELFARALEEYRKALTEVPASGGDISKAEINFAIARVLLIADGASAEGITELQNAINEGFKNIAALEELSNHRRITAANRDRIRNIISNM
jgi:tetratricopeptide (TPR) repeat protein